MLTSSTTRENKDGKKKCTKKRDARAKLFFCQSKAIAFLPFSLLSPSSLLKVPSNNTGTPAKQHRPAPS